MNYVALNAVFLSIVAVLLVATFIVVKRRFPWRASLLTLGVVLVLTAVFDNVMIGVGLVAYDEALLSGLYIGIAPLEDFAYTLAIAAIVPCVWMLTERRAE